MKDYNYDFKPDGEAEIIDSQSWRHGKAVWVITVGIVLACLAIVLLSGGCTDKGTFPKSMLQQVYEADSAHKECEAELERFTVQAQHRLDSLRFSDSTHVSTLYDSCRELRRQAFIAEFRLMRIDYHLSLVKKNKAKFGVFYQGWTDRDLHYELSLANDSALRATVKPIVAFDIKHELLSQSK